METIYLKEIRKQVDKRFVGFGPNGSAVKPVHIYSGASRIIYGESVDTQNIKRLSYVTGSKGEVPKSNTLDSVKEFLRESDALDEGIQDDDLTSFRNLLQKLLDADNGVFYSVNGDLVSYTAGSKYFITNYVMYEDAGEFVGSLINKCCPELRKHIKDILDSENDPISILFLPVAEANTKAIASDHLDEIEIFTSPNDEFNDFTTGIADAGKCLYKHLCNHPNQLTQLRIFNFFCIYVLIRYLASLESFYCEGKKRPFLLDFSDEASSSVAQASVMSYTQIHRAISRFYSWGYAQCLKEEGMTKADLLEIDAPMLDKKGKTKVGKVDLSRMWDLAKADAKELPEEDALLVFGATIYDMLALEASSHPVVYLRQLGTHAGLLYPPTNFHVNKRFVISQDMLEMIMRSCVEPNESLVATELKDRLWNRFGIVIGGDEIDMERIHVTGSIISADADSLRNNFAHFSETLEAINFADIMADGILQIRLGGVSK
ncbi:MAG: hypothetical protein LUH18_06735 [Oscillospiraceae bacterium]|nr:hypothetical protein [Oscillospiraceae bacterium]